MEKHGYPEDRHGRSGIDDIEQDLFLLVTARLVAVPTGGIARH